MNRENYWENRYQKEDGDIYGYEPSLSAFYALIEFKRKNVKTVLEIGGGTGRNSYLFASYGMKAVNVDTSQTAILQARRWHKKLSTENKIGDILKVDLSQQKFDGIFANFVLPFFTTKELGEIFKKISTCLKPGSMAVFSWLDRNDEYLKAGKYKDGQFVRFYSKKEIRDLFEKHQFLVLSFSKYRESELISGELRNTNLILSVAVKSV